MQLLTLAILVVGVAAKALTHALRDVPWARRPAFDGLPISDAYHVCSGLQWPAVFLCGWFAWGWDWRWWAAAVAAWGIVWPLSKIPKGLSLGAALRECWYWQIITWLRGG